VTVIAGVLALLVGLGTWLLPNPAQAVCTLTSYRFPGCNDVPNEYLGTWQGRVTMEAALVANGESGIDSVTIFRARQGEGTAAKQLGVDWHDAQGHDVGCSHEWQLDSVGSDRINFHVTKTDPNDPATVTGESGCLHDLTVSVRLLGHDKIEFTGIAGSSNPIILPPGTAVYRGILHRM
jgi:hypothetical protein